MKNSKHHQYIVDKLKPLRKDEVEEVWLTFGNERCKCRRFKAQREDIYPHLNGREFIYKRNGKIIKGILIQKDEKIWDQNDYKFIRSQNIYAIVEEKHNRE